MERKRFLDAELLDEEFDAVFLRDNHEFRRKRSSILKQAKIPNLDLCDDEFDGRYERKIQNAKRVSFADTFQVKELNTGNIYDIPGQNALESSKESSLSLQHPDLNSYVDKENVDSNALRFSVAKAMQSINLNMPQKQIILQREILAEDMSLSESIIVSSDFDKLPFNSTTLPNGLNKQTDLLGEQNMNMTLLPGNDQNYSDLRDDVEEEKFPTCTIVTSVSCMTHSFHSANSKANCLLQGRSPITQIEVPVVDDHLYLADIPIYSNDPDKENIYHKKLSAIASAKQSQKKDFRVALNDVNNQKPKSQKALRPIFASEDICESSEKKALKSVVLSENTSKPSEIEAYVPKSAEQTRLIVDEMDLTCDITSLVDCASQPPGFIGQQAHESVKNSIDVEDGSKTKHFQSNYLDFTCVSVESKKSLEIKNFDRLNLYSASNEIDMTCDHRNVIKNINHLDNNPGNLLKNPTSIEFNDYGENTLPYSQTLPLHCKSMEFTCVVPHKSRAISYHAPDFNASHVSDQFPLNSDKNVSLMDISSKEPAGRFSQILSEKEKGDYTQRKSLAMEVTLCSPKSTKCNLSILNSESMLGGNDEVFDIQGRSEHSLRKECFNSMSRLKHDSTKYVDGKETQHFSSDYMDITNWTRLSQGKLSLKGLEQAPKNAIPPETESSLINNDVYSLSQKVCNVTSGSLSAATSIVESIGNQTPILISESNKISNSNVKSHIFEETCSDIPLNDVHMQDDPIILPTSLENVSTNSTKLGQSTQKSFQPLEPLSVEKENSTMDNTNQSNMEIENNAKYLGKNTLHFSSGAMDFTCQPSVLPNTSNSSELIRDEENILSKKKEKNTFRFSSPAMDFTCQPSVLLNPPNTKQNDLEKENYALNLASTETNLSCFPSVLSNLPLSVSSEGKENVPTDVFGKNASHAMDLTCQPQGLSNKSSFREFSCPPTQWKADKQAFQNLDPAANELSTGNSILNSFEMDDSNFLNTNSLHMLSSQYKSTNEAINNQKLNFKPLPSHSESNSKNFSTIERKEFIQGENKALECMTEAPEYNVIQEKNSSCRSMLCENNGKLEIEKRVEEKVNEIVCPEKILNNADEAFEIGEESESVGIQSNSDSKVGNFFSDSPKLYSKKQLSKDSNSLKRPLPATPGVVYMLRKIKKHKGDCDNEQRGSGNQESRNNLKDSVSKVGIQSKTNISAPITVNNITNIDSLPTFIKQCVTPSENDQISNGITPFTTVFSELPSSIFQNISLKEAAPDVRIADMSLECSTSETTSKTSELEQRLQEKVECNTKPKSSNLESSFVNIKSVTSELKQSLQEKEAFLDIPKTSALLESSSVNIKNVTTEIKQSIQEDNMPLEIPRTPASSEPSLVNTKNVTTEIKQSIQEDNMPLEIPRTPASSEPSLVNTKTVIKELQPTLQEEKIYLDIPKSPVLQESPIVNMKNVTLELKEDLQAKELYSDTLKASLPQQLCVLNRENITADLKENLQKKENCIAIPENSVSLERCIVDMKSVTAEVTPSLSEKMELVVPKSPVLFESSTVNREVGNVLGLKSSQYLHEAAEGDVPEVTISLESSITNSKGSRFEQDLEQNFQAKVVFSPIASPRNTLKEKMVITSSLKIQHSETTSTMTDRINSVQSYQQATSSAPNSDSTDGSVVTELSVETHIKTTAEMKLELRSPNMKELICPSNLNISSSMKEDNLPVHPKSSVPEPLNAVLELETKETISSEKSSKIICPKEVLPISSHPSYLPDTSESESITDLLRKYFTVASEKLCKMLTGSSDPVIAKSANEKKLMPVDSAVSLQEFKDYLEKASSGEQCKWTLKTLKQNKAVFQLSWGSQVGWLKYTCTLFLHIQQTSSNESSVEFLRGDDDDFDSITELGYKAFHHLVQEKSLMHPICSKKTLLKLSEYSSLALKAETLMKDMLKLFFSRYTYEISEEVDPLRIQIHVDNKKRRSKCLLTCSIDLNSYPDVKIVPEIKHQFFNNITEEIQKAIALVEPGKNYIWNITVAAHSV